MPSGRGPAIGPALTLDNAPMELVAGPALRWTRALLVAAVAFAAGLVAHLSSDGLLPGLPQLALLYAGCAAATAGFLGRPASTRLVVALLVAGQTGIHLGLTAMAGHADEHEQAAGVLNGLHELVQHLLTDLSEHPLMALAHLAAAAAVGLWLAAGERAFWTLVCLLTDRAVAALGRLVAALRALTEYDAWPGGVVPLDRADDRTPAAQLLVHGVSRRGPPALLRA